MKLAKLSGSEKQIAWAERIRKDRLTVWQESDPEEFEVVKMELLQQDSSAWWITYRDRSLEEVIKHITYGVKWQALKEKKTPGKKAASSPTQRDALSVPMNPMTATTGADCIRIETPTGFQLIGPTKNILTGEVVEDDSLPF